MHVKIKIKNHWVADRNTLRSYEHSAFFNNQIFLQNPHWSLNFSLLFTVSRFFAEQKSEDLHQRIQIKKKKERELNNTGNMGNSDCIMEWTQKHIFVLNLASAISILFGLVTKYVRAATSVPLSVQ